jgi:hypothetical protein
VAHDFASAGEADPGDPDGFADDEGDGEDEEYDDEERYEPSLLTAHSFRRQGFVIAALAVVPLIVPALLIWGVAPDWATMGFGSRAAVVIMALAFLAIPATMAWRYLRVQAERRIDPPPETLVTGLGSFLKETEPSDSLETASATTPDEVLSPS